ncbi:iron complex transport system ATP-binding protein [Steroidobacter denitrificans]|uniref:Iron complex transport system ATP-binding protein n=1 Tax=Steroidobacter denitrificans TaxID=465721 RepID=A0A127FES5_STEDE|nr:ABC transporter ATP-binding protein [Steroidobacter denitrificans]AMN48411.1 iron complex transport system ATP-binding protein [Steroidobacter denitrificans]
MTASTREILAASNVSLALGGNAALRGVSTRFETGKVSVLLGPNGAGKSSLLACLSGLRCPESGFVTLNGENVLTLARRDRARRIGLLPQAPEIHWDIDVMTLVSLGRLPHRGRGGETNEDREAIAQAMLATDVAKLSTRTARQLSGGERARVLLARVLAGKPQWLLADEPLANLDPAHQLDVLEQLCRIARQGVGVVLVLHDLSFAARIADFVVLLHEGQVLSSGSRHQVLHPEPIREAFGIDAHFGMVGDANPYVVPLRRYRK